MNAADGGLLTEMRQQTRRRRETQTTNKREAKWDTDLRPEFLLEQAAQPEKHNSDRFQRMTPANNNQSPVGIA